MKTLRRPLALLMALVMVLGLMTVGVAADNGYTTPAVEGKNDPNSAVYLEQKSYDPETGVLTMSLSGKLDPTLATAGATGWNMVSFILSFDNTKLAVYDASSPDVVGENGSAEGEEIVWSDYEEIVQLFTAKGNGSKNKAYSVQETDHRVYVKGDRTAYYMAISSGGATPYGQVPGTKYVIADLTFQVAEVDGAYPTDLSKVFTKDTLRFATWEKDEAVMEGVYNTAANDGFAALFMVMGGGNDVRRMYSPMGGADTTGFEAADSEHKLMQATVVYDGVDNVTPGSLTGDLVTETAVEYNTAEAKTVTVNTADLVLKDTDGAAITIDGDKYKINYTVSHDGVGFGDITYADGKITIPADLVKASVASDTDITVTVNATLEGTSIKLSDSFTLTVAASEVTTISGPSTVVRGQSAGQVLKYDYEAFDQYGIPCETTWVMYSPTPDAHGFYENDTFVDSETVNGKDSVVVGFGHYSADTVYLYAGGKEKIITVTDLMAADGATMPTVQDFTYGDYSSFAQAVTAPATIALVDGYTASNPVIVVCKTDGTEVTEVAAGEYYVYVDYSTDFNGAEFTYGPMELTVDQKTVQLTSASAAQKVYDGTTAYADPVTVIIDGVVGNDDVTASGNAKFEDANAGTGKGVNITNITLSGADKANYKLASTAGYIPNGVITPAEVTITAADSYTKITKEYDGKTGCSDYINPDAFVVTGIVEADKSTFNASGIHYSASFENANVGENKNVTVGYFGITSVLLEDNYTVVTESVTLKGSITPKTITPVLDASDKVYDNDDSVDNYTVSFTGLVSGETLAEGTDYQVSNLKFSHYTIGSKGVTGTIALKDTVAAKNYKLSTTALSDDDAEIVDLRLAEQPKLKDGPFVYGETGFDDLIDMPDLEGLIVGLEPTDAVRYQVAAENAYGMEIFSRFYDSDAKFPTDPVPVEAVCVKINFYTADGERVPAEKLTGFTIAPKALTVTASGTVSKEYDGTTAVDDEVTLTLNGVVGDDEVIAEYTGAVYADKNAGTGKTVTVNGITLTGSKAANYTVDTTCTTTGAITPAAITVKAASGASVTKEYDGTTAVPAGKITADLFELEGVYEGDTVNVVVTNASGAYNSKDVASAEKITVSGLAIDNANYKISDAGVAVKAEINPIEITPALNASNKVADETTAVKSYEVTFTGLVSGDSLTENTDYTVSGLAFAGTAVGTKGVTGTIALKDTVAAKNYTLSTTALSDADAEIVDLYLADEPTADKTFTYGDETYASAITMPDMEDLIVGTESADAVKFDIAAYDENGDKIFEKTGLTALPTDYIDAAVKKVSITFYDAANNAVPAADITGFDIDKLELDITTGDVEKTYDGTTAFTGTTTVELDGVMSGDVVTVESWTIEFDDAAAGEDKGYSIDVVLGGADKDNYTVTSAWTTGAVINPKSVTVSYNGSDLTKVYDGTTAFDGSVFTTAEFPVDSFISGDDVSISADSAAFNSKDVATATKVVVSGFEITGIDKANYVLTNTTVEIPATITPASITATLNVANKVWDGTDEAFSHTVSFTGLVNGETTTDYTASGVKFSGTDAGSAATGTVTLAEGSNYELTSTTVTGTITKNTSAEVTVATKTGSDGTVTLIVTVTVTDSEGNTVTVTDPEYTATPAAPEAGDTITVTVDNDNYSSDDGAELVYNPGITVIFNCSDAELAAINDSTTVLDNLDAAFANELSTSGNDVHITVVVDVLGVEYDDDVIKAVELAVTASKVVDSKGAVAMLTLADELVLTLNVPESVDKAYAKVEGSNSTEYIELAEGEEVLTLTIESKNVLSESPYAIEFTDDDGTSDEGVIVGPAVLVYTTAKPGGVVYPELKYVSKGGSTYIAIAPNPGYTIDTIKINGVVVDYKDMLVGPNDAGLYHLRLTKLNRDTFVEISFKLKGQFVWQNPFTDVSITDWFYSSVEFASVNGLFNGTSATTFGPEQYMTRAMLVTVLHRLEGGPIMYSKSSFKDVPVGKYYTEAVAWASAVGIVTGNTDGTFNPDGLVTREQMAAILWRYAKYKGYDVSIGEETNILSYDDAFSVSEYAIPAMQWACGTGIINGVTPSTLQPKANATRAVVATILMRFCNYYLK